MCADCACSLADLDPDSPIWRNLTAAFMRTQPEPGQPEPIGKLAARGLLQALADAADITRQPEAEREP